MRLFSSLIILALVLVPNLSSAQTHSANAQCEQALAPKAFTLQQQMLKLRLSLNYFTVSRGLRKANGLPRISCLREFPYLKVACSREGYEDLLDPRFLPALESLNENGHWIDLGTGRGTAILEYLTDKKIQKKARVTGLGFAKPARAYVKTIQRLSPTFQYIEGDIEQSDESQLEMADVMTDLFGPGMYAPHFDIVLQKSFNRLKKGGLYFSSHAVWANGNSEPLAFIFKNGKVVSIKEYIQMTPGLEWIESEKSTAITIRKTSDQVQIPRLELISFRSGGPPLRIYHLK